MKEKITVKIQKKTFLKILMVVTSVTLFIAIPSVARSEDLDVGLLLPLSGPGAPWGIAYSKMIELKFKEVNDAGGWKVGDKIYKFKLHKEDDKYLGSAAAQATARLVYDRKVKVIFGSVGSSPVLAMHPITTENKIPVFCNSFAKDALSPERKYNFRVYPTSYEYAPIVWKYAKKRWPDIKYVVVIGQNDATGRSEAEDIKKACEPLGIKVDIELFEPGEKEFYPLLTRVLAKKPDAMDPTACALGSASLIMKQARELGYKGRYISSVFLDPDLNGPIAGADNIEGSLTIVWDWAKGSPGEKAVYKKWTDNWAPKEWAMFAGFWYSGVEIYLEAIQKIGSTDADKIRELIQSGYAFTTTAFGKIKFKGKEYYGQDHNIYVPVIVSEIQNGKLVEVYRE